jgi:DNA-binding beta-propeller fold protein YncE
VWRLDANAVQLTSVLHLRQGPKTIAVGASAVWTANDDGTVSRIDPATGQLVRTIPLGRYPRIAYPVGIAVGAGRVWVAMR